MDSSKQPWSKQQASSKQLAFPVQPLVLKASCCCCCCCNFCFVLLLLPFALLLPSGNPARQQRHLHAPFLPLLV